MTDTKTTQDPATDVVDPTGTDQTPVDGATGDTGAASAGEADPKPVPAKTKRVRSPKQIDDETAHLDAEEQRALYVTCAGCGEEVILNVTETVGTQPPVTYHGCEPMTRAMHEWFLALTRDEIVDAPPTTL